MKRCTKCNELKSIDDFHRDARKRDGRVAVCKQCQSLYAAEHYNRNKEKYQKMRREYYLENKETMITSQRNYYAANKNQRALTAKEWQRNNPEKVKAAQKKYKEKFPDVASIATKKWKAQNPEKVKAIRRKYYLKYKTKPSFRMSGRISNGIRYSLGKGGKANSHWEDLVGFTAEQLVKHLEKQFKPGMTWENYGSYWQIDHIIPIAAFNFATPEDIDFKRCWALKNLRPLEAKENMRKGAKIDRPFQPSLALAM